MNNADTNELYWVAILRILDPFININTDRPASYKAAGNLSQYFGRLQLEHKASARALDPTHCSRDKQTLNATTHKQNEIEGDYIPAMPGLLTEKWKCKQIVWVTERRGLSTMK